MLINQRREHAFSGCLFYRLDPSILLRQPWQDWYDKNVNTRRQTTLASLYYTTSFKTYSDVSTAMMISIEDVHNPYLICASRCPRTSIKILSMITRSRWLCLTIQVTYSKTRYLSSMNRMRDANPLTCIICLALEVVTTHTCEWRTGSPYLNTTEFNSVLCLTSPNKDFKTIVKTMSQGFALVPTRSVDVQAPFVVPPAIAAIGTDNWVPNIHQ